VVVVGRADTVAGRAWAWASKFSARGALEWNHDWSASTEYHSDLFPYSDLFSYSDLFAVVDAGDDAIIAAGTMVGPRREGLAPRRVGLIVKIDAGGSIAWTRTLALAGSTEVRGVLREATGDFTIVGSFGESLLDHALFVASISADGQIGVPTTIGQGRVNGVHQLPGRGSVVNSDSGDVIRLDQARQPVWRRKVEGAGAATGLADGSIVLSHRANDGEGLRLSRLDAQGEPLWERRWGDPLGCVGLATGVWRSPGDDLVMVSVTCNDPPSVVIFGVTEGGVTRLTRRVPLRPKAVPVIVRPVTNGSIVAAGIFDEEDGVDASKGWVFRSGPIRPMID
jgi:hypothetical protein